MRKTKQETREEKLSRQIQNLTRALEHEPTLKCLRERKTELEAQLRNMTFEERRALVPRSETERERKRNIATITEIISDYEKELVVKRQAVQETKGHIAELQKSRAKLVRQAPYS
jgi:polyhydroxyalkanoate synthesis regulator phasin